MGALRVFEGSTPASIQASSRLSLSNGTFPLLNLWFGSNLNAMQCTSPDCYHLTAAYEHRQKTFKMLARLHLKLHIPKGYPWYCLGYSRLCFVTYQKSSLRGDIKKSELHDIEFETIYIPNDRLQSLLSGMRPCFWIDVTNYAQASDNDLMNFRRHTERCQFARTSNRLGDRYMYLSTRILV